jgi:murein L,D-transpeptidase YcbB/YkuD
VKQAEFRSRSTGTSIAELDRGGVMSRVKVVTAIALLLVACGRESSKQQSRQDGAVGTSGRSPASVTTVLHAEPPVFVSRDREGTRLWNITQQFYQNRGDALAWIDGTKPRPAMDELIATLEKADRDGLDPALYSASTLSARRVDAGRGFVTTKGFEPSEAAELDVWLTYLFLQYASDLSEGVGDLSHADPKWQIRDKKADLLALLDKALDDNSVGRTLEDLTPHHPQYVALRDQLAKYREIAAHGGWPTLPSELKLKPNQQNPAVPLLAKRLAITGDYSGQIDEQALDYGPELQEAVKRFQRRHGLEPDAVVGSAAVAQMNVPVDQRIAEIALNLERWRWLPPTLGDRYILVNIPEFRLEVWDHDRVPLSMRVVVGKKDTPTPIFTDDMTHVVFAPYWNVPTDIVKKETLPSVLKDPNFLSRTNMEVLDKSGNAIDPSTIDLDNAGAYRFRQRPGASNSLGLVKFMFPNQFNVYLHDTPADSLFARATRSFSHGCVRLEQPQQLAQYVLGDQPDWTTEKIESAMHAGQEHTVRLTHPIPVYLGYWTARVSADGLLQFRSDLYGIDARQAALLSDTLSKLKARAAAASAQRGGQAPAVARKS